MDLFAEPNVFNFVTFIQAIISLEPYEDFIIRFPNQDLLGI
jgi:hypothetical protein